MKKRGFTLVELIVVLVILAILAAILVPALSGYIDRSKSVAISEESYNLRMAFQSAFAEEYGKGLGSGTIYYINGDRQNKYYMISNYSLNINSTLGPSDSIAKRMKSYLDSSVTWYKGAASNYMGKKVSEIRNIITASNQFAMCIIYKTDGDLKALYYYRNGYLSIFKDGILEIYNSNDSAACFPTDTQKTRYHDLIIT